MKPNVKANCKLCGKYYEKYVTPCKLRAGQGIYCSNKCSSSVGYKHSEATKKKISVAKIGNKNPQYGLREEKNQHWKGDSVGYFGVHDWLTRQYGQPKHCEHCGTEDESKRYEWANISGKYLRNRNDFYRLCKKCHNDFDGVNAWQNFLRSKGRVV